MAALRVFPRAGATGVRFFRAFMPTQQTAGLQDACHRVSIAEDGKVVMKDDRDLNFYSSWLRHNCRCSECHSQVFGQRKLAMEDLLGNVDLATLKIESVEMQGDNVCVNWRAAGTEKLRHSGHFPIQWLRENHYTNERKSKPQPLVAETMPEMTYSEVLSHDKELWRFLKILDKFGLCLLKGVPSHENSWKKLAEKIGPIQGSLKYGEAFSMSIGTDPNPVSISFTEAPLSLHSDEPYLENTAKLLVLHCLRKDECVVGGENVLLDAYPIVEELREKYPKQLKVLTETLVKFSHKISYNNEGHTVECGLLSPHIELDEDGKFFKVKIGPLYESTIRLAESEMDDYYEAYSLFLNMIYKSKAITRLLKPGEMYIIDNYRVLHGRNVIELNGGLRHFTGGFIGPDTFALRLAMLNGMFEKMNSK